MPEKKLAQLIAKHRWLKKPSKKTHMVGANLLLNHLSTLENECNGFLQEPGETEHIHQIRVASRRSRNVLLLFSACYPPSLYKKWQKKLQIITRSLGQVRDLDVQIDFVNQYYHRITEKNYQPGIKRLLLRLSQQRQNLHNIAEKNITGYLKKTIQKELEIPLPEENAATNLPVDLFLLAAEVIHWQVNNLLVAENSIYRESCVNEIHALRVDIKRLRYTMETFSALYKDEAAPFIKTLRDFQDRLGTIHDMDVWNMFLPQFLKQEEQDTQLYFGNTRSFSRILPGVNQFSEDCLAQRGVSYRDFISLWQRKKEQAFWNNLRLLAQETLQKQRSNILEEEDAEALITLPAAPE